MIERKTYGDVYIQRIGTTKSVFIQDYVTGTKIFEGEIKTGDLYSIALLEILKQLQQEKDEESFDMYKSEIVSRKDMLQRMFDSMPIGKEEWRY